MNDQTWILMQDSQNGDYLVECDGIVFCRIPRLIERKWPGTARKVAAASDMLAALREFMNDYESGGFHMSGYSAEKARAAIAKATETSGDR